MVDTWGRRSEFEYQGNVQQGTVIIYGNNNRITRKVEPVYRVPPWGREHSRMISP